MQQLDNLPHSQEQMPATELLRDIKGIPPTPWHLLHIRQGCRILPFTEPTPGTRQSSAYIFCSIICSQTPWDAERTSPLHVNRHPTEQLYDTLGSPAGHIPPSHAAEYPTGHSVITNSYGAVGRTWSFCIASGSPLLLTCFLQVFGEIPSAPGGIWACRCAVLEFLAAWPASI